MAPPPKRPPAPPPPENEGDAEGPATFFVRMDPNGDPAGEPPPEQPAGRAPKKGLQVQLPDDDAPPPPPPVRKPVVQGPAVDKKGRRGNWWDQKNKGEEEEPTDPGANPDDEPGATAMLKVDEPSPDDAPGATAMLNVKQAPPPRRRAAPRVEPEPEPEPEPEERPTVQRKKKMPSPDDNRTQMLDIRNVPSPEEVRQAAAREVAKQNAAKAGSGDAPADGWTATRVVAILIALALVLGVIAVAIGLFK